MTDSSETETYPPPPPSDTWAPDFLGRGHEARTMPLADDFEGEVVATLIRYRPDVDPEPPAPPADLPTPRYAVLYLHGWSDYLFNPEIGPFWAGEGGAFYAMDLRKYGRSLRTYQSKGYVDDLAVYDEDIEAALGLIAADHPDLPVVLMAHSTGGLTGALWANRNPGRLAALVLNAPWLETQGSTVVRNISMPLVQELGRHFPLREMPNPDLGFYNRTVSNKAEGEWEVIEAWHPPHSFTGRYGWLAAVLRGHTEVSEGLEIAEPVLVLRSARSLIVPTWEEAMRTSDVVIEVDVIAQRALGIGHTVTIATIDDALHDVLLSPPEIRAEAYRRISQWGRAYLP